jgi:two-component system, LuxR family, sensor kinase FixL
MPELPLDNPTLHASDDRLSALLNAAVDGMILIDLAGRITRFNPAAARLFGYTEAEVVGRNVNVLMPNPYHQEHDEYLARYLRTAEPHIIGIGREVVAQRKDGTHFPIDLSVGEFNNGREHGFVGILRDITERKRQEDELRKSHQQMELLFDAAPTAIAITDIRGQIRRVNRAYEQLLGYSTTDLKDLALSELLGTLVDPDDIPGVLADVETLLHTGQHFTRDITFRTKAGQRVHATIYAGALLGADQRPRLMVSQFIDRTTVYTAEHEAEALRARLSHVGRLGTLGEMVSGIAHEVNQPLTAIANYANALKRLLASNHANITEVAPTLEKISAQAERAGQIIHGLRKLTRKHDTEHTSIDCNALIREVSRLIEIDLRFSNHELHLELDPKDPKILGDGVQFQQIVMNLIRNAFEAMSETAQGQSVTVSTIVGTDDQMEIIVTDTGPGISTELENRLFEPFFTTKPRGMGLGLSICKSIISALGGQLSYRRASTGGAEFVIALPMISE